MHVGLLLVVTEMTKQRVADVKFYHQSF